MTVTNVTIPVVSGTGERGETLSTTNGTWTFDLDYLTYAYQWRRCDEDGLNCVDIAGATSNTYVLTGADVGSTIRSEVDATEHVAPAPVAGLRFALGTDADQTKSADVGEDIVGVHLMRSYDQLPSNSASAIQTVCAIFQSRQIRPYILCNWGDTANLATTLPGNLAAWAAAVGPGGTFYGANPGYAPYSVTHIEMGNEWFYSYRGGATQARAQAYATAFKATAQAVTAANAGVGLLFMIDIDNQGTTGWNNLVDYFYQAEADIHDYIAGYSIHTYGPLTSNPHITKVATLLARMESHGASNDIPIWITEDGISSDNGRTLSPNNYGWPQNMTYAQAGQGLRDKFTYLRTHPTWGDRLAVWTNYQAFDQQASGATTSREHYFGIVQQNGTSTKGDMTQSAIDHAVAYPGP